MNIISLFLGILLISVGLLCNEWTLAVLYSTDGSIENVFSKVAIWFADIMSILLGLIIIKNRNTITILGMLEKIIILAILSITLFLLVEQTSRCYLFGFACFNYYKMSTLGHLGVAGLAKRSTNPEIEYEYKPNLDTYNKLARFKTNSEGLRDKEYTIKKPQNTFRVVVLGGSYTQPSGVDIEESYHSILEDRLNKENPDTSFEFINFGVAGYHLNQKIATLKYRALKYEPDLILLALGSSVFRIRENIGNAEFLKYKHKPKPKNTFFQSFALQLLETNKILNYRRNQAKDEFKYSKKDIIRYDNIFKELNEISKIYNIPVCIAIIEHDYTHLEANKQTMFLLSKYGFHVVNTIQAFKDENFSDLIINRIDKHPNAKAQKIFADVIYDYLKKHSLLNRSDNL